jgi:hypothetical protein
MANEKIALSHNDIENLYPKTMIDPISAAQRAIYDKLFTISNSKDEPKEKKQETPEEEYIWVEGYKGTDKDMCCRGYQYELNEKFDMPEGAEIEVCDSGFHLCPELRQVFQYYDIGNGNRFFKVMAYIPKKQTKPVYSVWSGVSAPNKYAAKSIVFLSELTPREILNAKYGEDKIKDFTDDELLEVLTTSLGAVTKRKTIAELVALGYSEDIATIIFANDREHLARALVKQENISWDARIIALFSR